jgi:lysozyme
MKQPSDACYSLIKDFEGASLNAYADPIGIPTIGYGTIAYPDGTKVKLGDTITQEQADEYLEYEVNEKAKGVQKAIDTDTLTQGQMDALVSFAYNLGIGNLRSSTLFKKAKLYPNDPTIRDEFDKWVRAGGQILKGLVRRRKAEADLYFS